MAKQQSNVQSLGHVFGQALRRLREEKGWTQDELARLARRDAGLPWTPGIVVALETGRRETVGLDEIVLAGYIFHTRPSEWFEGEGLVSITPHAHVQLSTLRDLLDGAAANKWRVRDDENWKIPAADPKRAEELGHRLRETLATGRRVLGRKPKTKEMISALQASGDQATRKAAAKLQVDPVALSFTAMVLWGHSLTEERERRVEAGNLTGRSLSALRGHVTRELLEEIEPHVVRNLDKSKTKRRKR